MVLGIYSERWHHFDGINLAPRKIKKIHKRSTLYFYALSITKKKSPTQHIFELLLCVKGSQLIMQQRAEEHVSVFKLCE